MYLDWLWINKVRNLSDVKIEAEPRLNLIIGENASGKTAILESIYLLARARSFRTPRIQEVIKKGEETLQVTAGASNTLNGKITIGVEKSTDQIILRNNGLSVKTVSEHAKNFPLVLITPDTHLLVTGPPKQRRHWLDWAMFHVEQHYLENWQSYFKALRQRNILLKKGCQNNELYEGWERIMVEAGGRILDARRRFIKKLQNISNPLLNKVFYGNFEIKFDPGNYTEQGQFRAYLVDERAKDRLCGFTRNGPHRADFDFVYDNERVATTFSRGQIKLFASIFILAEAMALSELRKENPIILMDDYEAELDSKHSEYLLSALYMSPFQIFLTAVRKEAILPSLNTSAWFHVEQGKVQKMVK